MKNLFDTANYPDEVPSSLVAGYRWAWTRGVVTEAYPTALYTLSYRLAKLDDPNTQYTITASKISDAHVVEVAQADTIEYLPGDYEYRCFIVRDSDGEEVHIESGHITMAASYEYEGDTANWVYKVLTAVRAALQSTATSDQLEIEVAGRRLVRRSTDELLRLEQDFTRRWQKIKDTQAREAGKSTDTRTLVKMRA